MPRQSFHRQSGGAGREPRGRGRKASSTCRRLNADGSHRPECVGDGRWFIERSSLCQRTRRVRQAHRPEPGRPVSHRHGHIRIEAADLMRARAAQLFDRKRPCGAEATMAKYRQPIVVGGCERRDPDLRRLRLHRGIRHRAKVPRPVCTRSRRFRRPGPELRGRARARAAGSYDAAAEGRPSSPGAGRRGAARHATSGGPRRARDQN